MITREDLFSNTGDDLMTHEYDGTYGASTGIRPVRTCHSCGALVDAADEALDKHVGFHVVVGR